MEKKGRSAKVVGVAKKAVKAVKEVARKTPALKPAKAAARKPGMKDDFWRCVEFRAYEIYSKRGSDHGNDQDDWYEAERQVRAELGL